MSSDRIVHAVSKTGATEVVRYDRQGRWYLEQSGAPQRMRLTTVQAAAAQAVAMEQDGGIIFTGKPGGKQFDAKVLGARRKAG